MGFFLNSAVCKVVQCWRHLQVLICQCVDCLLGGTEAVLPFLLISVHMYSYKYRNINFCILAYGVAGAYHLSLKLMIIINELTLNLKNHATFI
jgi:hypothetical protein